MTFTPCEFFFNFYANSPKLDGITRKNIQPSRKKNKLEYYSVLGCVELLELFRHFRNYPFRTLKDAIFFNFLLNSYFESF